MGKIVFKESFDEWFLLYLPKAWNEVIVKGNAANILHNEKVRQSISLLPKNEWHDPLMKFLQDDEVISFFATPIYKPHFDKWIFITFDMNSKTHWIYAVYGSGNYMMLIKADASNENEFKMQLTSLMNSNPWYGWIQTAMNQQKK